MAPEGRELQLASLAIIEQRGQVPPLIEEFWEVSEEFDRNLAMTALRFYHVTERDERLILGRGYSTISSE